MHILSLSQRTGSSDTLNQIDVLFYTGTVSRINIYKISFVQYDRVSFSRRRDLHVGVSYLVLLPYRLTFYNWYRTLHL